MAPSLPTALGGRARYPEEPCNRLHATSCLSLSCPPLQILGDIHLIQTINIIIVFVISGLVRVPAPASRRYAFSASGKKTLTNQCRSCLACCLIQSSSG